LNTELPKTDSSGVKTWYEQVDSLAFGKHNKLGVSLLPADRVCRFDMRHCAKFCTSVKPLPRHCDFSTLKLTAVRHLGFSKGWPIECHGEGQNASLYQILRQSVEPLLRFGHFLIFQDGGRRHLGFLKRQTFNGRTRQESRTASPCQILSKSLKVRPTYGDCSTFQYGGCRHLGFLNL